MSRSIIVSSGPATTPVSTTEAKAHLRVTSSSDDTYIGTLITVATADAEKFLGRALITQTIQVRDDCWPKDGIIHLPRAPVASVSSIKYYDEDGTLQPLSTAEYFTSLYGDDTRIVFTPEATWPALQDGKPGAVVVEYVAGYGAAGSDVPAMIRAGILFRIAHLYEERTNEVRGQVSLINFGTERCWEPYRVWTLR